MNLQQLRALHAAKAAYRFLTQDPLPPALAKASPSFQQQVSALKDLIDAISARGTEQITDVRKDRNAMRNQAAAQLRDDTLRPLRQLAQVIAKSHPAGALHPEFPGTISVPKTSNVDAIVQAARMTVQQLTPYQALFVARGLAPDFLAQLTEETDALEALADTAHDARGTQVNATRDIGRLLRETRALLRGIGVAVRRLCAKDGARGKVTYGTWLQLKRPQQPSGASDVTDATGDPATVATPASATSTSVTPATPTPAVA